MRLLLRVQAGAGDRRGLGGEQRRTKGRHLGEDAESVSIQFLTGESDCCTVHTIAIL